MSDNVNHQPQFLIDNAIHTAKENAALTSLIPEEFLHHLLLNGVFSSLEKASVSTTLKKHELSILFSEFRESRCNSNGHCENELKDGGLLIYCKGTKRSFEYALKQLRLLDFDISLHKSNAMSKIWFPRHISELSRCKSVSSEVEPHLDSTHPGFRDKIYRERREYICNLAKDHEIGTILPYVDYTEEETKTWRAVYTGLSAYHQKWACSEYLRCFKALEEKKLYSSEFIPQLQDVSSYLEECTGFQLCPVSGLLSARDFLASLAFKVFQCTQYVRHHTSPMHTPEPDCCHELLGHVPMLCDPTFAEFSQEVGLASLGASDEDVVKLSTLYWFTVEFGLCKENGELKAYGAGLLSSFGELEHAVSDIPEHLPLDVKKTSLQPYQDATYQPVYFVSSSFDKAVAQVRTYSDENINRNFLVRFNDEKKFVEVLPKLF